jgi:hypothetical protein
MIHADELSQPSDSRCSTTLLGRFWSSIVGGTKLPHKLKPPVLSTVDERHDAIAPRLRPRNSVFWPIETILLVKIVYRKELDQFVTFIVVGE